jgi:RNA polymerase sigma-70 factor (ECF subfamily)
VGREQPGGFTLPDESALHLAERLVASGTSPSRRLLRDELRQRVRAALERLAPHDREVLVMCYLEGLPFAAIAAILGITENAAKVRHFRALERIRKLMEHDDGGELGR